MDPWGEEKPNKKVFEDYDAINITHNSLSR